MKTFMKALDRKVLNPETRLKSITWIYMAFACVLLLHHIYVTAYFKTVLTGARDLFIPFILFAGASFFMGKLWKDKLFWVFTALLLLKVTRTAMFGSYALEVSVTYFVMSVYAFFICYAVARVLPRDSWKAFLSVFCFLWTVAALVFVAFGLKVAFTGIPISNLGSESFIVNADHRLYLIYNAVSSGVVLSVCMSITVFGCILAKNKVLRLFYIAAALVLFFTCSLTGTRTAFIMSGLNLALLLYIPLHDKLLKPSANGNHLQAAGKHILLILSVLVVTGGIAYAQSKTIHLLTLSQGNSLLVSPANAEDDVIPDVPEKVTDEEATLSDIQERGFNLTDDQYGFLNGRFEHWGCVLEVDFASAENLLLGQSVYNTMIPINELRSSRELHYLYHCHNTYLQYLTENGLPAFLLYCGFVLVFLIHAIRVLMNRNLPLWQRALPLCGIICVLEGVVDNTCHVNYAYPQMTAMYLFIGFTVALSPDTKKKKEALSA